VSRRANDAIYGVSQFLVEKVLERMKERKEI
jgi:hypothetical protein